MLVGTSAKEAMLCPERSRLANYSKVAPIRCFNAAIAGLGESEPRSFQLSAALCVVGNLYRCKIPIVCVHAKDSKEATESCKVATDHLLEVGNVTATPSEEVVWGQEPHLDQDINGRELIVRLEKIRGRLNDARIERVILVVLQRRMRHRETWPSVA